MRIVGALLLAAGLLGLWAWLTDFVTPQGETTVYTVRCDGGYWEGRQCVGARMTAGDRYRFRALKAHNEVLFWTVGTSEPSGKFTDCQIDGGRTWTCKASPDAGRTIIQQMHMGKPVRTAGATALRPFHAVSKWHWLLASRGWSLSNNADS